MRLIMAIVQPTKLSNVRDALREVGIENLTICDAMGYGRQKGKTATFRGNEYKVDLLRKVVVEVSVQDQDVDRAIEAISRSALTGSQGQIGDGKIFVLPVAEIIDLATSPEEFG
ncbi:MAG: P-II family nitrogen regulator [Planctomycetota bacterium]